MSQQFDPYRIWLGIPPQHQPPNHYRLLGIEVFESDADVIANAADQRMVHLKTFATGKNSALSQKLLNEISAARLCLLNAAEKAKYDEILRSQLPRRVPVAPVASAAAVRENASNDFGPLAETLSAATSPRAAGANYAARKPRKNSQSMSTWIGLAIAGAAALILMVIVLPALMRDAPQQTTAQEVAANPATPPEKGSTPVPDKTTKKPTEKSPVTKTTEPPKETSPKVEEPVTTEDPLKAVPSEKDPPREDPSNKPDKPPRTVVTLRNPPPVSPDKGPEDERPLGPDGRPVEPQEQTTLPTAEPDPVEETPETRQSVPDNDAIKTAEKEIRDLFKDTIKEAIKPEQKLALATKLKQTAAESKDNPANHYTLLRMAAVWSADAGDIAGTFSLVDELGQTFDVNTVELKAGMLGKIDSAATKAGPQIALQAAPTILASARQIAEEAIGEGEMDPAAACLKIAAAAAQRTKDLALKRQIQETQKELDRLKAQAVVAKKAVEQLKTDADAPAANRDAGHWNCFVRGDWTTGLPQLAKSDDETLSGLAKRELADPEEGAQLLALGDAWMEQSTDKKGFELARIHEHAASWYRKALPKLSGLDRAKVEQKLEKAGIRVSSYALKFDGQKSYVVVKNCFYTANQPITVEVIAKFGPNHSGNTQTIVGNGSYPGFYLSRNYSDYSYNFSAYNSDQIFYKSTMAKMDVWNHLAIEFDGSKKAFYVNGKEASRYSIGGLYQVSTNPLVLGALPTRGTRTTPPIPTQFFQGEIRGLRISNTYRFTKDFTPPAELTSDANTWLLFQFAEGKGNVLKDSGHSKLQGEIVGAEWVKVDDLTIGSAENENDTQPPRMGNPAGNPPAAKPAAAKPPAGKFPADGG